MKEEMKRNDLPETAVIGLLWTCIMNAVEWNKKEELVAEQALKHLKVQVFIGGHRGCSPAAALTGMTAGFQPQFAPAQAKHIFPNFFLSKIATT